MEKFIVFLPFKNVNFFLIFLILCLKKNYFYGCLKYIFWFWLFTVKNIEEKIGINEYRGGIKLDGVPY